MQTSYRAVDAPRTALRPEAHASVAFTGAERRRLAALYGCIALLHAAGWGLCLWHAPRHPELVALGFAAYMFGLRHAFDADHIAAVDDTVRFMLRKGERPLGVGFFFSLGHSTVVFAMAAAIAVGAAAALHAMPALREIGGTIGMLVAGTFLWIIGLLNLAVLFDILSVWKRARAGKHNHAHLDEILARRGFVNRLLGGRLQGLVRHSWQMYPLGMLFGLGFDTASEIGLLAMTGGAAASPLPASAVLALPLVFAAGMSAMDTTDGVLMVKAYDWAFVNPLRKIFYNLAITAFSIATALVIGTLELLQVAISLFHLEGRLAGAILSFDLATTGWLIAGLFLAAWGASVAVWKLGGLEARCAAQSPAHAHEHSHAGGVSHTHRHFH